MKQLSVQTAEATQVIELKIGHMTDMVTQSVASLQTLVAAIGNVDIASASIGRAITEQANLGARLSSSLDSVRGAFLVLSREFREAAQLAANGGMLSEIVLETASSVDTLMLGLKGKLENIGAGLEPAAADAPPDAGTIGSSLSEGLAA
jgi:methyl-accepting chemotaxis protein